jgi:UDP-3-O-[3-hydroxymyristoyl] glucosamine N-acyltransferase
MQAVKAKDIAQLLNGELIGNPNVLVNKPAKIEEGEEGAISFFANPKYEKFVYECKSSVLLIPTDFLPRQELTATLIKVPDVYAALSVLLSHFEQAQKTTAQNANISPQAFIHPSAKIGNNVQIEAFAYISAGAQIADNVRISPQVWIDERVEIGENTELRAGAKIYKDTKIGKNCCVHSNAVIGKEGFGYAPLADGSYQKIPQLGIVEIADNVDIGANVVIDRATMGRTFIQKGVKLDNLIQIAHNVSIGENTVIAAQTGLAGSCQIGKNCQIGGQVGIVGHISIANGTKIQAQSGVDKTIKQENTALFGSPALPYNDFLRAYVLFKNLPNLQKRLIELENNDKKS